MKSFLKYTLATITGIILTSILFLIILLASLSAMVAAGNKSVSIDNNSILVLKAGVTIPDRGDSNPFASFDLVNMTITQTPGLNEILRNIEKASTDNKIKGILIENGLLQTGWATTKEIRDALVKFKSSGKFIISYSDYALIQEEYYLSTAADKIFLSPESVMEFKGLSAEVTFYKKALDKIGVEVQVLRHGKFKGAVEPYILDEISKENREQINQYIGSVWNNVLMDISASRKIPVDQLNKMADDLISVNVEDALAKGLIDGLIYRDQLNDTLKVLTGLNTTQELKFVSMLKYSNVPDPNKKVSVGNKIAVIYASGNIVMGKGNGTNIGGNQYADVISNARLDSTIKAIVLRVNSPGGSANASDLIWREVGLAAKIKPVIISMGNYAASGGYYISAPATRIFADPITISGSIGVFGLIPNAGELLSDKIGITFSTVNTNKNSDSPSMFRSLTPFEQDLMQANIEKTYSGFVDKVAEGRKMIQTRVDSIGQGRVWTGTDAKEIGLVDEIGGLNRAIEEAVKLTGKTDYSIVELPEIEDTYTRLLNSLSGELRMNIIKKEFGEAAKFYYDIEELKNTSGIQARLPYYIDIH
jgi:protease IV